MLQAMHDLLIFFTTQLIILVQEFMPIGRMNELEAANMAALKKELAGSIKKGVDFANGGP